MIVVFDLGGVLASNNDYSAFLERVDPERRTAALAAIDEEWNRVKVSPTATPESFWRAIMTGAQVDGDWNVYNDALCDASSAYPDTVALAQRLVAAGHSVGILSNHATHWFAHLYAKHNLGRVFDAFSKQVVVSAAVCAAKPHAECFEAFLATTNGARAAQCVFIDDKKRNVDAACAFGMRGILFNAEKDAIDVLERALAEAGVVLA